MWNPIETAPLDGSEFLGFDPVAKKCGVVTGEKLDPLKHIRDHWFAITICGNDHGPFDDEFQWERMTLWMPIPSPY